MGSRPPASDDALSAVVLAAGLSRRMGDVNKLLLAVDGVTLVRRAVSAVLSRPFAEVVVVTGHEASSVEAALDGLDVRLVYNAAYEQGQTTSVRAGLAALSAPARGVMVCLADQPWLTAEDLRVLGGAFLDRPDCAVLVPTYLGARGNPLVLARRSLIDILARGGNFGCRQFVARNSDLVTNFEMPNDHVLADIDRPEDYDAQRPVAMRERH
jgi:molybdenum cofactor cytidylyltransferase